MAAGTVVKTTYGYDIQTNEDAYNKLAIEAVSAVASLGLNGLTAVDLFPFRESCEQHDIMRFHSRVLSSAIRSHLVSWDEHFRPCKKDPHTYR